jgi:ornithine cyclodeaminase/alanine dehydrogenase-like protein (mu-crystallin family)
LLREADVENLLTMDMALDAVEDALRQMARGRTMNNPRTHVNTLDGSLAIMSAAMLDNGVMGLKAYTVFKAGARFVVLLYDGRTGGLLALIEANKLGQMRTGAASGVATKYMARPDSRTVGIFGTGWQARSQLSAVCAVRPIEKVVVFGRNQEKRLAFCREMTSVLHTEVVPAERAEDVITGVDIIVTATRARDPLFDGRRLESGVHINAIGANSLIRREVDEETLARSSAIVVDSKDQAKIECGEFLPAVEKGKLRWEAVRELADVVAGIIPGRAGRDEITFFKSLGLALEDVAAAKKVYERAMSEKLGERLSIF